MNRKLIAQEYFVLATNENGNMPVMRKDESNAGLVAAGVMDLLLNGIITMERKKITVRKALPGEFGCMISLYEYLNEKPRTIDKLMSDYLVSTGRRINQLKTAIGESLLADQVVTEGKGGLFGNKVTYIPERSYKEELAGLIKAAVEGDDAISPGDMALICILNETKNLKQYFPKYENAKLKTKLKEIKKNPGNKQLIDMINYVSDITTVAMACIVTSLT